MDKKNLTLGMLLLGTAFALMIFQQKQEMEQLATEQAEKARQSELQEQQPMPEESADFETVPVDAETENTAAPTTAEKATEAVPDDNEFALPEEFETSPEATLEEEKFWTLENDFIRVTFTNRGGAITEVALVGRDQHDQLLYPAVLDSDEPYRFNKISNNPALSINRRHAPGMPLLPMAPVYDLVEHDNDKVSLVHTTAQGLRIVRDYNISPTEDRAAPYVIKHRTTFIHEGKESLNMGRLYLNLGSFSPTEGDIWGQYLNAGYYDGDDADFIGVSKFKDSSGFLGFGASEAVPYVERPRSGDAEPIVWGSVKNQFFTAVATPTEPAESIYATGIDLTKPDAAPNALSKMGMTGYVGFEFGRIQPNSSQEIELTYYVGPKEVTRLEALGQKQDLVMQFGWLGWISKFLLVVMKLIHKLIVPIAPEWAWGFTIIILTVIIKLAMWPLTAVQVRSSRRMQKIAEPMKALKEKYKDNPEKIQQETMKLFREHQVNPAAGCLPLFIQMPIFIGLFFMLRTASELRFASFLWASDLSVPDTIAWLPNMPDFIPVFGGPVHVLPLIMAVTMFFQMKMMPSPSTDNMQAKIFQLMPFIFLFISYPFPSGLVIYWTVQNLLTILQTWVMRRKDDEEPVPAISSDEAASGNRRPRKSKKRR